MDRDKLLKDPEVYGTFAVFQVDEGLVEVQVCTGCLPSRNEGRVSKIPSTKDYRCLSDGGLVEKGPDSCESLDGNTVQSKAGTHWDLDGDFSRQASQNTYTFNGITKALAYVPSFLTN